MAVQMTYLGYIVAVKPLHAEILVWVVISEGLLLMLSYIALLYSGYISNLEILELAGYLELFLCLGLIAIKTA